MDQLKEQLPPNQVVISFFGTKLTLYGFMLSNEKYQSWKIGSPVAILNGLKTMYRQMGHFESNTEVTPEILAKTIGSKLWQEFKMPFWECSGESI